MNGITIDFELNAENQIKLAKTFKSFQWKYLTVYTLVMGTDWLQGPYLYKLYQSYGLGLTSISMLFLTGFISSAIAGTAIGSLADVYGRKRVCIIFCFTMIASLLLRLINAYPLLFVSHVLSGLSTALLYCVFEAWYVSEHASRGYPAEWRARTFALCTFLNSCAAIAAGVFANILVDVWGFKSPYVASIVLQAIVCSMIVSSWAENYGTDQMERKSLQRSLREGIYVMFQSRNIMVLAIAQTLFECSMYIFVLLYTPAIESVAENSNISLGYLFSTMMFAVMAGSLVFQLCERLNRYGTRLLSITSKERLLIIALGLASCSFMMMTYYGQYSAFLMVAAYHLFEFTTGLYYPSIASLKAECILEETRAVIMTLIRIPMNLGVGIIIWQIEDVSIAMMFSLCSVMTSVGCLIVICFYQDKV
ncbi:hypothetical protein RMCBS344292_03007 [Rhizopus microsporus]|nr:hypothetical protein RMCBS344292_03007 [Rhizopus microsporus]